MKQLIPHHSIEKYLPITLKEFENINQKSKICYRMIGGEQYYTFAEVKRFIREYLGTINEKETSNTYTDFY